MFLWLISGFWNLEILNPEFYNQRAQENHLKSIPIPAARGRILDRDGRVIADNRVSFTLALARESLQEGHLPLIARGLDLDCNDLTERLRHYQSQPQYVPVVIKEELSLADLAFVDSHREFFPELMVIQAYHRVYPQNGMLAHVIGYTGEVSEDELDSPEFTKYDPGDIIGKFGTEREYNSTLMGVAGQRQVMVDNRGHVRRVIGNKPAVPGKDIQLSIDLDLQVVAELAMDGRNGAVVALNPRTGEILAMVSRPTFDANKFAARIPAKDWKEIADNPDHPMLNRAVQAQQAPGSTFKPLVALAALETRTIDDRFTVHCTGGISLYGRYQHCWVKTGHGTISLHNGIVHSCDVYFYTVGAKLGINKIARYASLAGLGEPTGIDLPHEATGVVPSEKWKLRNFRQKWYPGETPSVAIGQGALTVTPLQLARAIGGVAMGGIWHHPHLLKTMDPTEEPAVSALTPANVRKVVDGMYGVVNEGGGTGGRARLPGIDVCGKTGSAQLASHDYLQGKAAGRNLKDNAWFEGFAPCHGPEIVVVALFEHGEHGQFAAPIVRDVIKAYFDKKARSSSEAQQNQASLTGTSGAEGLMRLPHSVPPAAPAKPATWDGNLIYHEADEEPEREAQQ